ncbi:hypothetical protein HYH02_008018 [Chlamydomonas schloesseri]|uniref:Uncharacterized protein n=1 Tax=Chlamydomonas schloesseri TaxID=2026947 RepID=A0A835WG97_9CHLO|nr:hypothetical protein HYH02_008018 [Chlamydomonas schloesseri]|eukprot:KAG2446861.1 hypothetical protein HYH02_008018 [Chlamydomonas schloesseri]
MTPNILTKLLVLAGLLAASASANSINVTQCAWDGVDCVLTSGFIASLPGRLGSTPTTNSAKVLARAAYRATVCANFTGSRVDCVGAATQYGCEWDAAAQSCGIKDLLDPELLRRSAFCPDSRLDAAVSCAALTSSGDGWQASCAAASYGGSTCKVVNSSSVLGSGPAQSLGDVVMGVVNGVAAQAVQAIKDAAGKLNVTLSNTTVALLVNNATATANSSQACVAGWTTNTTYLKSLADSVISGLRSGNDALSTLMTPELFGNCNTSTKLMSTVKTCPIKVNKADCTAVAGCNWIDLAQACTVAMDAVDRIMLQDPKDAWVAVYNNASALCDSLATESSCNATSPRLSVNLTIDPAILKNLSSLLPSFAIDVVNNITGGAGLSMGGSTILGGGGGGGAAGMAAASWWIAALAAVAALIVGHGLHQQ